MSVYALTGGNGEYHRRVLEAGPVLGTGDSPYEPNRNHSLAEAREDARFAQWEVGLQTSRHLERTIGEALAVRGYPMDTCGDVAVEAARDHVLRERLGHWARRYLETGILYWSTTDVAHAVHNFLYHTKVGRTYVNNVSLDQLLEDGFPHNDDAIAVCHRLSQRPDEALLSAETLHAIRRRRRSLSRRDQDLFDLLQESPLHSRERGDALRQFAVKHGVSPLPGTVHRWIRRLQASLLRDEVLAEILAPGH